MKFSKTITIAQILEKLETEYVLSVEDDFQALCRMRELKIKETINLCMNQIVELAEAPGIENLTTRQKYKAENCVENLTIYISELMGLLTLDKLIEACDEIQKSNLPVMRTIPFEPDIIFLIQNSFHSAIAANILWAPKITVTQAIGIGRGDLDLDDLGKHLPDLLNDVKLKVIPFLKSTDRYSGFENSIDEALKCYDMNLYRACNLLIMTTIEGMVRQLATFLAENHDLKNFSEEKYTSLNSLLRNVSWKKDYKIDLTRLELITDQRYRARNMVHDFQIIDDEYAMVDINTRLDFLKGRFKDDRDLILHCSYQDYNKKWNLFLNFSALCEVQQTCSYYEKRYHTNRI
ncbi:MAG: hypothetical protein A3D31_08795 [Candidatus Fluviicola riflensis]|nr:MAG: hypothetical protein CHH17_06200 [Candidatus Fluviicola riflensis]OGS80033.1 MAG: hypothetical protein A3D31_08795 [Candidatus Fluviicola riflensis]OGS82548.1 MAG: hypothetical protein A2724_17740 [Fluviicola sp. RIFCSPHIGHO2_01_FULL_43_53]OGS88212.1 MAG: hypothetical protein A3E30_15175 [Fluviicola sp. RIFCSPHIGHO2_12_FULL_43_24]